MGVLTAEELGVATREDGRVVLEVPIGGRRRRILMTAEAAQWIGTLLENAGFDALGEEVPYPEVAEVQLRPYDASARAALKLRFAKGGGPLVVELRESVLRALSEAARAALEHMIDGGRA